MSQIPRTDRSRAVGGFSNPVQLTSAQLDAPGVTPTPYAPNMNNLAAATQALGFTGQILANANQERMRLEAEADLEQRRAEAKDEQLRSRNEAIDKNLSATAQSQWFAEAGPQIAEGKIAPRPGETTKDFKNRLVAEQTVGATPTYRDHFDALVGDNIIRATVDRAKMIEVQTQKTIDDTSVSNVTAKDSYLDALEGIQNAKKADPTMTDARLTTVAVRSMELAAENGNVKVVEAMTDWLGDKEPEKQAKAQNLLAQYETRQQAATNAAFKDGVAALRVGGASMEQIDAFMAANAKMVRPDTVESEVTATKAWFAEDLRKARAKTIKTEREAFLVGDSQSVLDAVDLYGPIAAPTVEDFSYDLPSGDTVSGSGSMRTKARIGEARRRSGWGENGWAGMADTQQAAYVNRLAGLNVVDQDLKRLVNGFDFAQEGATQADVAVADNFRRIRGANPIYADKLLETDSKAGMVLLWADSLMDLGQTPQAAIAQAKARAKEDVPAPALGPILQAVQKEWPKSNGPLGARVARYAQGIAAGTGDPKSAVERAVTDYKRVTATVNGKSAPMLGFSTTDERTKLAFGEAMQNTITSRIDGLKLGLDAGDFTVIPNGPNSWRLVSQTADVQLLAAADPASLVITTDQVQPMIKQELRKRQISQGEIPFIDLSYKEIDKEISKAMDEYVRIEVDVAKVSGLPGVYPPAVVDPVALRAQIEGADVKAWWKEIRTDVRGQLPGGQQQMKQLARIVQLREARLSKFVMDKAKK